MHGVEVTLGKPLVYGGDFKISNCIVLTPSDSGLDQTPVYINILNDEIRKHVASYSVKQRRIFVRRVLVSELNLLDVVFSCLQGRQLVILRHPFLDSNYTIKLITAIGEVVVESDFLLAD